MQLINLGIMKEPLNWVIVALMVAMAAFGLALVLGSRGGVIAQTGSAGISDSQPGADG
jgi:hypothetical protein